MYHQRITASLFKRRNASGLQVVEGTASSPDMFDDFFGECAVDFVACGVFQEHSEICKYRS